MSNQLDKMRRSDNLIKAPAKPARMPSPSMQSLAARANAAAKRLEIAKATGTPSERAAARQDAEVIHKEFKVAKAADEALAAMRDALSRPIKI